MSRRGRVVGGVSVVGAALLYLLGTGLGNNLVYFLTPSEILARGTEAYGTPLRLRGKVEPGSIRWNAESREVRFRVRDDSSAVDVESTGIPPEMFHDGIDVVLEGSLAATGVFRATSLMVKHSNEYGPADPGDRPAERLRGLGGPEGKP